MFIISFVLLGMKNLILIICIAFIAFGCGKDKTVDKSQYVVGVIPDLVSNADEPVLIKYRISGPDIKTIDNLGPGSTINYIYLPKGKSTTITVAIYEGPQRYISVGISKVDDKAQPSENVVFNQMALNQISATFTVK